MKRSPASVGDTLRVVRASRRTPSRSSSALIVWLRAEGVTPSLAAALVKLWSRATATKACKSFTFGYAIAEIFSQPHQEDRKSVVKGKRVSVGINHGGRGTI